MLFNTAHLIETASLLLAAYVIGCGLGYGLRRVLYAARGTRQVKPVAVALAVPAAPEIRRPRSPAARLAATVDVENLPPPSRVAGPRVVEAVARPTPSTGKPRPAALDAPRGGIADNLKQIKGIGPKIEASLQDLGIFHLEQIAAWSRADVDWVDTQLAFKGRIGRERWVEQAAELGKLKSVA